MRHDFKESLARSQAQADAPWWPRLYREAFPAMVEMTYMPAGSKEQLAGIDRKIVLRSGAEIFVDEKVRYKNYDDIALERWSNLERRIAGWVQKDCYCDYIAYAKVPTQTCYLFPFQTLRRAWRLNGRAWIAKAEAGMPVGWKGGRPHEGIDGFSVFRAPNYGYVTENIGVPLHALEDALRDAMTIRWEPRPADAPAMTPSAVFNRQWGRTVENRAQEIMALDGFPPDAIQDARELARMEILRGLGEGID